MRILKLKFFTEFSFPHEELLQDEVFVNLPLLFLAINPPSLDEGSIALDYNGLAVLDLNLHLLLALLRREELSLIGIMHVVADALTVYARCSYARLPLVVAFLPCGQLTHSCAGVSKGD